MPDSRDRLARALGTTSPLVVDVFGTSAWPRTGSPGPITETIPADTLADTTIHRGRASARDATDPATLGLTLVGGLENLALATPFRLRLTDAALDTIFGSHTSAPALAARARFTGQVSDLGPLILTSRTSTPRIPLAAAGITARLGRADVSQIQYPYPAGWSDSEVLSDLLFYSWDSDPGISIAEWWTNWTAWYAPLIARPDMPVTLQYVEWLPDFTRPAADLVAQLVETTAGVLIEQRDGRIDWIIPANRRNAPLAVTLDASQILDGAAVAQDPAQLINSVTVQYGPPDAQLSTVITDDLSVSKFGRYPLTISTLIADLDTATQMGSDLVGRYAWPMWQLPSVTVDVLYLIETGQLATVRQLLSAESGALCQINGLPSASPIGSAYFWIEGSDETITARSWRITLNLAAYVLLAAPLEWQEVPSTVHWNDVPADLTWLQATDWQPVPFPTGAWRAQPADRRWNAVGATTTWNAYT